MITWVTVWILTVAPYKSGAFQLEFQTKQQCITQYNFQLQKYKENVHKLSCTETKRPMVTK